MARRVGEDRPSRLGGTEDKHTRRHLVSLEQGILLRVEAAAVLLGVGRTMMYELIQRGAIPVVRIGRRTLVHRTDLEQFAEEQRQR